MLTQLTWQLEAIFGLIFPEQCVICGWAGGLICKPCRSRLEPYPLAPTPVGLDAMSVAWLYDREVRHAIHALKYQRQQRVALALADALADGLTAPPGEALIPVPLHPRRLAERGFNQAEVLARRLAWRWHLPVRAEGLVRARETGHQAQLGQKERQSNVAGAFVWQAPRPPPARVLLVDDVLTTGATLIACANALRAVGTREVRAVALARSLAPQGRVLQ
ncbi:ComF family protein [Candidatus Viridilinea mediisalina]|uniref:Amidophosphoribosyltransferase n=1 Tax=Candidatus Viridilinea mediisalina TaxID=2024553 RepID=A0A2A6RNI8_9CHLR|nr:phosphoribosyltransferase family protein [Candidatus Viridilinea mediisalina]PDW04486.1 amidophosphoribosyltransferase [Candidatus Viridilinea mediisalina]